MSKNTLTKLLVFGMCHSAYGKRLRLKLKVIYWLYRIVIAILLIYDSIAWWPRTKLATYRQAQNKDQHLACLFITGEFKTTPTATMEVFS